MSRASLTACVMSEVYCHSCGGLEFALALGIVELPWGLKHHETKGAYLHVAGA